MSDTRGRKIKVKEIKVRSYISPSKLPTVDFVINPYVGCPHKCIYCYASFMKRFVAGHNSEDWGDFIDVKLCDEPINIKNSSTTLLGSVTDPYNPFEAKYLITKDILQQLVAQSPCNAKYDILTKSSLVLRDMDLLKKIKNIRVGISMNTLDDGFRKQIEPYAVSVESRIETLKCLSENGINTYLFMSPIFPGITDFRKIVTKVRPFIKIAYFENLNLRGSYRARVLNFIRTKYPNVASLFNEIYVEKKNDYWENLLKEINFFCQKNSIPHDTYFYHPTK